MQIRIRIESKAIQASRKSLDIVHYTIGASWGPWWSHVCWIYNCLCIQYISPLKLWIWISLRRGVLDKTLCDKISRWLATDPWFSLGIPVSSTNTTDNHDIAEILLKVALNTITLTFFSDLSLFYLPSFIQKLFGMNHNHTKRCIQWYFINWGISTTRVWKIQIRIRIEYKAMQASRKSLDIVH